MNKYQNGKIYKIVDVGYKKCYIGSTTETLSQRLARHRRAYRQWKEGKRDNVSIFSMFDEIGIDNCKIELIENCPVSNIEELLRKEGEHIRLNDCVNKRIAGRTQSERREASKEHYQEYQKQYRDNHKEELTQYFLEYRQNNKEKINKQTLCECGGSYVHKNRTRHFKTTRHQNYQNQQEEK